MSASITSLSSVQRPGPVAAGPQADALGLEISPFKVNIGAVVRGLDFNQPVPAPVAARLRQALLDHGVLFFYPGELAREAFSDFADLFGTVARHNAYVPALEQGAKARSIDVIESATTRIPPRNDVWHIDGTYTATPPDITVLYGHRVPSIGGDTMWTHAALAYRRLDPALAAYLETLTAVHSFESTGLTTWDKASLEQKIDMRAKYPPLDVPVIRTHPETGEKQIFVTEAVTGYIRGLSRVASLSILNLLFDHLKNPEFEARFEWKQGALAIWDNRTVQHRVVTDYDPTQRVMYRATLNSHGRRQPETAAPQAGAQ